MSNNGNPELVIKEALFTGDENHQITLTEAKSLLRRYQEDPATDSRMCGYFSKAAILSVLNQDGAVGLRYYLGMAKNGDIKIILVGTDRYGDDLIDGITLDLAAGCPPFCGDSMLSDIIKDAPY